MVGSNHQTVTSCRHIEWDDVNTVSGIKIRSDYCAIQHNYPSNKKNQRNNIYSDIIKDSVVKNERFKIKDSYNWSSFASSVMIIEKMVEHIQQLKKNIATIDQQFSQDDSSRYDFVAMIQIGTINKIIEVNETLRDYMLISPATDWGEIGDREKIYIDELLDKMESDNNSLNQLLSELYNE